MTTATPLATAALRLHERGEVWTDSGPLTTVLYQLRILYRAAEEVRTDAHEARRIEVEGTILRYGRNWETLSEPRNEALWLRLWDGRRIKFRVTASAGAAALHIAGVHDDEFDVKPLDVPEIDQQHRHLADLLNQVGTSPRHWLLQRRLVMTPSQPLVDASFQY